MIRPRIKVINPTPDVLQAFSKARVLCEKLGDQNELFVALCGGASYHMISFNAASAVTMGFFVNK